jgi:hypothetical protein
MAASAYQSTQGIARNLELPHETAFSRALEIVAPRASGRQLVPLFDGKANRTTILNWRNGRRAVPHWAIEILRHIHATKGAELDNHLREATQKETGPGKRAGAINIKRWNAANPR